MIERKGETRWCTGDKKHKTISHSRGVTATTVAIPTKTKEGRRRCCVGQGNNKVKEDFNWGACDHCLDAPNVRAKEAAHMKLKKGTVDALQLPG
jgi:hypothetical protein